MVKKLRELRWGYLAMAVVVFVGTLWVDHLQGQRRQPLRVPVRANVNNIGRFQISGNLRIDTATGRTWEAKRVKVRRPIDTVVDGENKTRLCWYECYTKYRVQEEREQREHQLRELRQRNLPVPNNGESD